MKKYVIIKCMNYKGKIMSGEIVENGINEKYYLMNDGCRYSFEALRDNFKAEFFDELP